MLQFANTLALPYPNVSSNRPPQGLRSLKKPLPFPALSIPFRHSSHPSTASLKSRLRNGDTLYGIFLLSFSPTIAEIAALSGYDYVVIDMEHGPGSINDSLHCIRAAAAAGIPSILRVPETSASWAKKALDLGPAGLMFPMIDTPAHATQAVSYCRFPPQGVRGSAHPVVRASKYGINEAYLSDYIEEFLVICQVETLDGVRHASEIAAIEGVDCVQMGPLDLSASMGCLTNPADERVVDTLHIAEKRVLESGGAWLGGFAMPHDPPLNLKARGYNVVSGAVDIGLFRVAAVEDVNHFRNN